VKIIMRSVDTLVGDPKNARTHDKRNIDAIAASLQAFGQRKPVVVRDSVVLAGNGTLTAARLLGWTKIAVVNAPDDWDENTARAYALADNRTAELASWDTTLLYDQLADLSIEGWDTEALQFDSPLSDVPFTPDEDVPEPPQHPISKSGDLYLLGGSRVLCGDSTSADDVARLLQGREPADCMWTDPPYGVSYVGKTKKALTIENDGAEGLDSLLSAAFEAAEKALRPGAPFYIAHPAGAMSMSFYKAVLDRNWQFRQQLVWVKNTMVLGHADYHYKHEPIIFGYLPGGSGRKGRGGTLNWHGDNSQTSIFEVDKPSRSAEHPTMKPVELVQQMIRNSCPPKGTVYDPFGGSGSTLIAAHTLGMTALTIELDPAYVDVICRRWETLTGTPPLHEPTQKPRTFLKPLESKHG
jgi:DNA modification methylase